MIVPGGYKVKARFALHGRRLLVLQALGVLLLFAFIPILSTITTRAHSCFDQTAFLAKFDTPTMLLVLGLGLIALVVIHSYVHERIHQVSYRFFMGEWPELHMNLVTPNITLPKGMVCTRDQAIIGALAPLVLLGCLGLLIWLTVNDNDILFLVIFFLSANLGLAAADIVESIWLAKHPRRYLFGYDGVDSVLYGDG